MRYFKCFCLLTLDPFSPISPSAPGMPYYEQACYELNDSTDNLLQLQFVLATQLYRLNLVFPKIIIRLKSILNIITHLLTLIPAGPVGPAFPACPYDINNI